MNLVDTVRIELTYHYKLVKAINNGRNLSCPYRVNTHQVAMAVGNLTVIYER